MVRHVCPSKPEIVYMCFQLIDYAFDYDKQSKRYTVARLGYQDVKQINQSSTYLKL